jgi:hypothetical protein
MEDRVETRVKISEPADGGEALGYCDEHERLIIFTSRTKQFPVQFTSCRRKTIRDRRESRNTYETKEVRNSSWNSRGYVRGLVAIIHLMIHRKRVRDALLADKTRTLD